MAGYADTIKRTRNRIFQRTPKHKESFVIYTYEYKKKNKIHNIESYETVQVQNAFAMQEFRGIHPQ